MWHIAERNVKMIPFIKLIIEELEFRKHKQLSSFENRHWVTKWQTSFFFKWKNTIKCFEDLMCSTQLLFSYFSCAWRNKTVRKFGTYIYFAHLDPYFPFPIHVCPFGAVNVDWWVRNEWLFYSSVMFTLALQISSKVLSWFRAQE